MNYLLDTNVFVEAHRRYYSFPLCPGFWEALVWHHGAGQVSSIDKVREELMDTGDDLSEWVQRTMPGPCFISTDSEPAIAAYREVVRWVQAQAQFRDEAKAKFADDADAWLIAYALAHRTDLTLVTHEQSAPRAKRTVKIPDVCSHFDVAVTDTFDMLKELEVKFLWQSFH